MGLLNVNLEPRSPKVPDTKCRVSGRGNHDGKIGIAAASHVSKFMVMASERLNLLTRVHIVEVA